MAAIYSSDNQIITEEMKSEITYISHNEIDTSKWDECVKNAQNGFVFGYSWYLDSVCDSWDALVLNDYEAVFPITKKSKFGLKYFVNPIFALQLGIFSKNKITSDLFDSFLQNIPSKFKLIDIQLNCENKYIGDDFEISDKTCQYIHLNEAYSVISQKYSSNLKRNLSKARKNNLEIVLSVDTESVVKLFKENRGGSLSEMREEQYERLNALLKKMRENKMGKIYECWFGKELIASACFSNCNGRIVYIKGGTTQKGRDLGAMHLIMDEVIHLNSGREIIFDFGGSSIPQVSRFNHGFGAIDYIYQRLYRNKLPLLIRLLKK